MNDYIDTTIDIDGILYKIQFIVTEIEEGIIKVKCLGLSKPL